MRTNFQHICVLVCQVACTAQATSEVFPAAGSLVCMACEEDLCLSKTHLHRFVEV